MTRSHGFSQGNAEESNDQVEYLVRNNEGYIVEVRGEKKQVISEDRFDAAVTAATTTNSEGNELVVLADTSESIPPDFRSTPAYAPESKVKILTGVYDNSGAAPSGVAGESLDIAVTRPDGTEESFTETTDENGSVLITYNLSDADRGTGEYEVAVTDNAGTEVTTQWKAGYGVFCTSASTGQIFTDNAVRYEFLVSEGTEGVANVELTLRFLESGETVKETTTTTDSDGFAGITATPQSTGLHRFEADLDGSTVASRSVEAVDIIGAVDYDLDDARVGSTNSFGAYLYSSDGPVANFEFTLKFYEDSLRREENLFLERSVTSDAHGFFMIDYDIPEDFDDSSLYVKTETNSDQRIELDSFEIIVSDPGSGGGGGGSSVRLDVDEDSSEYAPGERITLEVEATDGGSPITNQSVDVFLQYGFSGPPLYSTTVTTDSDGRATTSTTIPTEAPDGDYLDGSVGMEYNGSTYTDDVFGEIAEYDIDFNYPDITPGESTEYSIEVTSNKTGDPVEGIPYQLDAVYDSGRSGSFGTAKLVSDADGTDSTTIRAPQDVAFSALAIDFNRYFGSSFQNVTDPEYPGSLSTDDTLVAGEPAEFSFSVPDDVTLSGLVFGDRPVRKTYGTRFDGPGKFSMMIPEEAEAGDRLFLTVWGVDDSGEKYEANGGFEVDRATISVDASGEDNVNVGGEATISISARRVDQLKIEKIWTDWTLSSSDSDGGSINNQIADFGAVTINYDSVQSSVSPSLTFSLKNRYKSGTYRLSVAGSNPDDEADEAAGFFVIE